MSFLEAFTRLDDVRAMSLQFEPVGSRVTCVPAPTSTDEDFLVLIPRGSWGIVHEKLNKMGYMLGGSPVMDESGGVEADGGFGSYKLLATNLIITDDPRFFDRFMAATSIAKRLNLLSKSDRIALFQAVLYGNACV